MEQFKVYWDKYGVFAIIAIAVYFLFINKKGKTYTRRGYRMARRGYSYARRRMPRRRRRR